MTTRRKIGIAVTSLGTFMVVLIMLGTRPEPTPRIALQFVRYDFDRKTALLQVTNLSRFEVSCFYLTPLCVGPIATNIPPGGMRDLTLRVSGLHKSPPDVPASAGKVTYVRTPSGFKARLKRQLWRIGILKPTKPNSNSNWLEMSIDLPPPPPPPKTPLP